MTKKNIWLIGFLLVLMIIYIWFFTDWFKTRTIRVYSLVPPAVVSRNLYHHHAQIIFGLMGRYQLNEVKVVPLAAYQKNRMALPIWHLVSDDGSDPVKQFAYGQHIRGMDPEYQGDEAQPLETNVVYRLFVTAGKIHGTHDFEIKGQ